MAGIVLNTNLFNIPNNPGELGSTHTNKYNDAPTIKNNKVRIARYTII